MDQQQTVVEALWLQKVSLKLMLMPDRFTRYPGTLDTLRACSSDIEEKCGSPLTGLVSYQTSSSRNATKKKELEECAALADGFKKGGTSFHVLMHMLTLKLTFSI